jgi:hypothetical protein
MNTFPEIKLTATKLKVVLTAEYEITDRDTANMVEDHVEEALAKLRELGEAEVEFTAEAVER